MAVTVRTQGIQPFRPGNIRNYQVVEDATPMDISSMDGGYGTTTFDVLDSPDLKLIRTRRFDLEDSVQGKTAGIVTNLRANGEEVSVTADSLLGVLNSWQHVPAFEGSFGDLINLWFGKLGLTTQVKYENNIDLIPVVTQAYVGNMWDHMKQFLSANKVEMSLVFDRIVFREYRWYEAYTERSINDGWDVNQGQTAQAVEVTYYNNRFITSEEVYPVPDSDEEPTIMQVDNQETVEYTLDLSATVNSVDRSPVAQDYVDSGPQPSSVYAVTGNDELNIPAAQWRDAGGDLQVEINPDDPSQLIVTITGADIEHLAPFRIALSSGSGNYYNTLHIHGTGVAYVEKTLRIPTGADRNTTGTEIGVTVTNPFVSSKSEALDLGVKTAAAYSGLNYTVSGDAVNINRRGRDTGITALISDFNAYWPDTATISDFNAARSGWTMIEFNEFWATDALAQFQTQAFGNAVGSRVRRGDAYFRITNATFNPVSVSYNATVDTTVRDFNSEWANNATIADFNTVYNGLLVTDYNMIPLRTEV